MNRSARALVSLLALLLVSGCGQKGALYLPNSKKTTVPPVPAAAPSTPAPAPTPTPAAPPA